MGPQVFDTIFSYIFLSLLSVHILLLTEVDGCLSDYNGLGLVGIGHVGTRTLFQSNLLGYGGWLERPGQGDVLDDELLIKVSNQLRDTLRECEPCVVLLYLGLLLYERLQALCSSYHTLIRRFPWLSHLRSIGSQGRNCVGRFKLSQVRV